MEHYQGEYDSESSFAYQIADDMIECSDVEPNSFLTIYFDYEAFARDLFIGDYISLDVDGSTHIFQRH